MNQVGKTNASNREAWIEQALAQVPQGSRILDAGAGEQQFKKFCAHLTYVSQDFGEYEGQGDGKGLQTGSWDQSDLDIVCDITAIPEPDGSFDAIMCTEVFEHLPNPIAAIAEFSRLIRPGGYLIVTAPFCSWTHFAPYHYYSGFNRYFYQFHLPKHRFDTIQLESNGNFFECIAQETRKIKNRAKKYAANRPRFYEKWCLKVILNMLARFSQRDSSSDELLCFGYHILAQKKARADNAE
jgi:ubiquinone/menaquinone biosynthesis C-methylase UbiE